jgi:proline racemase
LLKIYEDNGGKVEVNWYCRDIDYEVVLEEVEDYMEESDLKINVISYSD